MEEQKKIEFECPICHGKEFDSKNKFNGVYGPGGCGHVEYYFCTSCSVHFSDPKKFTLKKKTKKKKED